MASVKALGNGKYRVFVCNGFKPDGKVNRSSKVITAKSDRDAEKQAEELEVNFRHEKAEPDSKNVTFNYLVDKWRELKEGDLAEKTKVRYEGILKDFMLPAFGRYKVTEIRPLDIEKYLNKLKNDGVRKDGKPGGYSQKTIQHHYVLLHKLFSLAVRWDYVPSNVCDKVDKPKVDKKEAAFYEEEQIVQMLKCLESESMMHKAYVLIALVSACRRSEVLGLEWRDINFENNLIKVNRVSLYSAEKGIYTKDTLKNGSPSKTITIPVEVMKFLKEYKDWQDNTRAEKGDQWTYSERLFIEETGGSIAAAGTAIHPDNISQWFERFLLKNDLPKITLHQVRHTSISYLLNNNIDLQTVSKRAGHTDCTITSTIYGHVMEKNKRECADQFSKLFDIEF